MAVQMRDEFARLLHELRYESTPKRVRGFLDDECVVDSTRALLVWEPRRVTPSYAVPVEDVAARLTPGPQAEVSSAPILHPGIPFRFHSVAGEPRTISTHRGERAGAAFALEGPGVDGYVELDFTALTWREEDETVVGHPRDPFARVDVRRSDRHVRVTVDGVLLAESKHPVLVFETYLPVRYYLPREDLHVTLSPSPRTTVCPYKGQASYYVVDVNGTPRDDLLWSYESPLVDARALTGLVGFLDELVQIEVDGQAPERPDDAISQALLDELGAAPGGR